MSAYEQVTEIYQAAIQGEHVGRVTTRLDLGYLLSPIGLGLLDMRADTNPTILPHFSYLMPMPSFDRAAPRSWPIASSYPPGAQFTASTTKWDARVALLGSPPNRSFVLNANSPNPPSRPIVVFGGGVTPRTGLRFGAGMSVGNYATESELLPAIAGNGTPASNGGRGLRMLALEAEWAFGSTKLSGEFTHDVIDTASGTTTADEWFVQGIQTLAPRWFVAGRHEGANAPPSPATLSLRSTLRISEATLGYHLSRELTLRGSFVSRKLYFGPQHDQQGGASLVWARRWW